MPSEPLWLPPEEVVRINRDTVAETGEPFFLRDRGLLESALARPRHLWSYGEDDVVTLAVALLFGIARNHPFEQGNKRTGLIAADLFLATNGYTFNAYDSEEFGRFIESVIVGDTTEERFTEIIRRDVIRTNPSVIQV